MIKMYIVGLKSALNSIKSLLTQKQCRIQFHFYLKYVPVSRKNIHMLFLCGMVTGGFQNFQ